LLPLLFGRTGSTAPEELEFKGTSLENEVSAEGISRSKFDGESELTGTGAKPEASAVWSIAFTSDWLESGNAERIPALATYAAPLAAIRDSAERPFARKMFMTGKLPIHTLRNALGKSKK
jgi:hypothetical protein